MFLISNITILLFPKIIFDGLWLFILFGSFWIPQIIANFRKGPDGVPNKFFVISSTLNNLIFPVYINIFSSNFMFLQQSFFVGFITIVWAAVQVRVLYVGVPKIKELFSQYLGQSNKQQEEPQLYDDSDYEKFTITFEHDAALSSRSFLSDYIAQNFENVNGFTFGDMSIEQRGDAAMIRYNHLM